MKSETKQIFTSNIKGHVIRLLPGNDLYKEIEKYIKDNNIKAGFIMSCVGSLKEVNIRLANAKDFLKEKKNYEITSLVGCVSCNDRMHLHISISDDIGKTYGGHLYKEGNLIFTTAEIVIGELSELNFTKEFCKESGWDELKIDIKK